MENAYEKAVETDCNQQCANRKSRQIGKQRRAGNTAQLHQLGERRAEGGIEHQRRCHGERQHRERAREIGARGCMDLRNRIFRAVNNAAGQPQVQRPNGIAVSEDSKTLYVIDSHPKPGGNRTVFFA